MKAQMYLIGKKAEDAKDRSLLKLQKEILKTESKLADSKNMKKRDKKRNEKLQTKELVEDEKEIT